MKFFKEVFMAFQIIKTIS